MRPMAAGNSSSRAGVLSRMNQILHPRRLRGAVLVLVMAAGLSGCGAAAFPVRTTSAAVKIVPVAGDVVAAPLDWTANTID